jgi:hypothetical protein
MAAIGDKIMQSKLFLEIYMRIDWDDVELVFHVFF